MVVYNSKYNISNGNDFDVYHFESNAKMIKVLDNSKAEIGNLENLLITGVAKNSGNISDLKMYGKYRVSNVNDLPLELNKTKTYLVEVSTIGDLQNPIIRQYTLVDTDGSIYNRTISNTNGDSGWSSGGASVQRDITEIKNSMGNNNTLNTNSKNVIGAINELLASITGVSNAVDESSHHNHDSRYIRRDADTDISANVNILAGSGVNVKQNGVSTNLISANTSKIINVGNAGYKVNIQGSGNLTYNNAKVWTDTNDGINSGLDADLLRGVNGQNYARTDINQDFNAKPNFKRGISVDANQTVDLGGMSVRANTVGSDTTLSFLKNGISTTRINTANGITSYGLDLQNPNGDTTLVMKNQTADLGQGFVVDNTGRLQFKNMQNNQVLYSVPKLGSVVEFTKEIQIAGKKLFLQSTEPTGDIPDGSVWIG